MSENELNSNEQIITSGNPETDIIIERCPDDELNPYTMVRNDLIRDINISPECRWLIIYLLSNKPGWRINIQQVVNHLKQHMGRTKVYALFDEAIQAGYIKKDDILSDSKKGGKIRSGVRYLLSENAKFKKFNRHSENRHTGDRHTGKTDYKKYNTDKKDYEEEILSTPPIPPQPVEVKPEPTANAESAKASEAEVLNSPKPKRTRTPPEFSPIVKQVADNMINALILHKPNYVPPRILAGFLTHVDYLLRLDKRDPSLAMDVFSWALSDSFWADKMYKPNPAEYLRKQFDQLEMKMNSKPTTPPQKERKFAPSSNDDRAYEMMKEMSSRAI